MSDFPSETWKPVVRFEGLYEVSDQGSVRSVARKKATRWGGICDIQGVLLTPEISKFGYQRVTLFCDSKRNRKFVHRIVVEAHIGPIAEGLEINHIDGKKSNNAVINLEIVTKSQNKLHHMYVLGARASTVAHLQRGVAVARAEGRVPKPPVFHGEASHSAKLTEDIVREIRATPKHFGVDAKLARKFGVTHRVITLVRQRKAWAHVD